MILRRIESCLVLTVGIDPQATGRARLEAAVRRRMQLRDASSPDAYAALLAEEPEEARRLAAEVAVHETWFYRYPASFRHLVAHLRGRLPRVPTGNRCRVLCLGCSTGEEPASVVLASHEAGLDVGLLSVDAVDVSERAIAYARAGRYTARALHETPPSVRDAWFTAEGDGYRLDPRVVGHPRYRLANVLDPTYRPDGTYDAVFCRNLLIYLVPAARRVVLDRILGGLAPDGLLFLGHAEASVARSVGLVPDGPPEAFASRRGPAEARAPSRAVPAPARAAPPREPARAAVPRLPDTAIPDLVQALTLADQGRLDASRRMVDALLAGGERSAALFHLLATLESAEGKSDAARAALGKALYLDPDHEPSLVHLALLVEAEGDPAYARRLRNRARGPAARRSAAPTNAPTPEAEHGDR